MTPELKKRIDKFHKIAPYSSIMNDHVASEIIQDLTKYIEELEKKLLTATDTLKYIAMVDMEMNLSHESALSQRMFDISEAKKALKEIGGEG